MSSDLVQSTELYEALQTKSRKIESTESAHLNYTGTGPIRCILSLTIDSDGKTGGGTGTGLGVGVGSWSNEPVSLHLFVESLAKFEELLAAGSFLVATIPSVDGPAGRFELHKPELIVFLNKGREAIGYIQLVDSLVKPVGEASGPFKWE